MTPTDDELRHQELLKAIRSIRDGFHEVAEAIRSTREGIDGFIAGYSSDYCEHCHQRGHADKYDPECPQYEPYESPEEHGLPSIPLGAATPDGRTIDDLRQNSGDVPSGQTRILEINETSGPGKPVTSADVVDETRGGQQ